MPRTCMVKDCPSSRGLCTRKISLFSLPKDPITYAKWCEKVDLKIQRNSQARHRDVICSLHFAENCIVLTGSNSPRLTWAAIPLEFKQNGQKILSLDYDEANEEEDLTATNIRTEPQEEVVGTVKRTTRHDSDQINSFDEFCNGLNKEHREIWAQNWNVFDEPDFVCFYRVSKNALNYRDIAISFRITVHSDMVVTVFDNENEASPDELNWILTASKLQLWTQFHNLIQYYSSEPDIVPKSNTYYLMMKALESLNTIKTTAKIDSMIDPIKTLLRNVVDQIDPLSNDVLIKDEPEMEITEHSKVFEEQFILDERYGQLIPNSDTAIIVESLDDEIIEDDPKSLKIKPIKRQSKQYTPRANKPTIECEPQECKICQKICQTPQKLKMHVYNCHPETSFCCDFCGKIFKSMKLLKCHMSRHDPSARKKCPHCDDVMLAESLWRHIRVRHQKLRPYNCSICQRPFSNLTLIKAHELTHSKNAQYDKYMVKRDNGSFYYQCPNCEYSSELGFKLKLHIRCHRPKSDGVILKSKHLQYRYPCIHNECFKSFHTKKAAAHHMEKNHKIVIANVERFCFECKKEVTENFVKHMNEHNCRFVCSICNQRFAADHVLKKHIAEKHPEGEDRPFACRLCIATFKTSNHLRSHMATKHTTEDDKRYCCSECPRKFIFNYMLTAHMKSHSSIASHQCPHGDCPRVFKKLSHMKDHALRAHGLDCYQCNDCVNLWFKTLNDLKNHRRETHET